MRRLISATLVAAALATSSCGGEVDKDAATSPTHTTAAPTATPDSVSQLPPAFVQCMADRGFTVTSSDDVHSAPPDVLQTCFGTLHGGGG